MNQHDLVLLGGGHAHVGVLKSFGIKPIPGVRVTLISDVSLAPYSGMIPGYIAGIYKEEECHMDLWPLSKFAKARFYLDQAIGVDLDCKQVILKNRPPVHFDILSINTGSTPTKIPGSDDFAIAVKPISHLLSKLQKVTAEILADSQSDKLNIVVVGAGAGGVELCLALQTKLERELPQKAIDYHLVFNGPTPLATHNKKVQKIFKRILKEQNVQLYPQEKIKEITAQEIICHSGNSISYDYVFLVTNAAADPMFKKSGFDVDAQGFIQVNTYLQSTSHPYVFAAGDIAAIKKHPRPKSGVYSVRAAKPLGHNLRASIKKHSLRQYKSQKTALALITTGKKYAIASKGKWACEGKWLWWLKNHIDRKFMYKHQKV